MPRCCRRLYSRLIVLLLPAAFLLGGCAGGGGRWDPEDYTVKSGDTVYSIAWRYEIDPEEFAAWNRLGRAKLIRPGQRLHTRPPADYRPGEPGAGEAAGDRSKPGQVAYATGNTRPVKPEKPGRSTDIPASARWIKAEKGDTLYSISRRSGVSVRRLAQLNQLKPPYVIRPGQTIFLQPLNTAGGHKTTKAKPSSGQAAGKPPKAAASPAQSTAYRWPASIHWQRPAQGRVVKKFSRWKNDAKGIDIAGRRGDPVVAAAAGKVVYSGNGLISYGNLVIIKHNRSYLSAYAYNRKLLVREGDTVRAGQKIAEMGSKDEHGALLHFEIRKNGKPVDPLKYIPR